MNANLERIIDNLGKVDGLMAALEMMCMDLEVAEKDREIANRGSYVFYAMWDIIKKIAEDLDLVEDDCNVVRAIRRSQEK